MQSLFGQTDCYLTVTRCQLINDHQPAATHAQARPHSDFIHPTTGVACLDLAYADLSQASRLRLCRASGDILLSAILASREAVLRNLS